MCLHSLTYLEDEFMKLANVSENSAGHAIFPRNSWQKKSAFPLHI